jgi:hypothetical protein
LRRQHSFVYKAEEDLTKKGLFYIIQYSQQPSEAVNPKFSGAMYRGPFAGEIEVIVAADIREGVFCPPADSAKSRNDGRSVTVVVEASTSGPVVTLPVFSQSANSSSQIEP